MSLEGDHHLMETNEASNTQAPAVLPETLTSKSLVSELIPFYLEHVRIEQGRVLVT